MLSLQFEVDPQLVMVKWDDTTNLATWHSKEEIESHWEQSPFRCVNVGYLIAMDGTGALYIASRKGMFNEQDDAWGLIERIPIGVITSMVYLKEETTQ